MDLSAAAKKIKVVVLDVDGVLTDGRIGYGCASDDEIKFFDVKDGSGITMLRRAGLKVGIISGRKSLANRRRAQELKLDFLRENCLPKLPAFLELLQELAVLPEECLYIGDDLIDLPILKRAGIGVAVGDAVQEVKQAASMVTKACGGRGAIRETAEWLLRRQNLWDKALQFYEQ